VSFGGKKLGNGQEKGKKRQLTEGMTEKTLTYLTVLLDTSVSFSFPRSPKTQKSHCESDAPLPPRTICRYPYAQNPRAGTGRLVRVLALLTEDDTGTVLYSAVPILAKCHYWNIRDSSVCIGMTIRVLAFLTEDDTGTGLFDRGRYGYWPF
jgi:hypothetical protein